MNEDKVDKISLNKKLLKELNKQEEAVITKMFELKNRLINSEFNESNNECNLWINTDFKKLNLTNSDQRKAYVKKEMAKIIKTSGLYKNQIYLCENVLKLIRSKKRFLLETDYEIDDYVYYSEMIENLFKDLHIE